MPNQVHYLVSAAASGTTTALSGGSIGDIGRGVVVGFSTGFFGGVGFGARGVSFTARSFAEVTGSGVSGTISGFFGAVIATLVTSIDIVGQVAAVEVNDVPQGDSYESGG